MNREDIERMAREFGFVPHYTRPQDAVVRNGYALSGELKGYKAGMLDIERFFHAAYAAGAAAEREACAKVCENIEEWQGEGSLELDPYYSATYAAAIRARGQQ